MDTMIINKPTPAVCLFLDLAKRKVPSTMPAFQNLGKKNAKTYNSGDSLVVTHLTTNPPVSCLYMAERTGSLIFMILWSYVEERVVVEVYIGGKRSGMNDHLRKPLL